MGAHDFKLNKVPIFARKPGNINVLMSAAPKLALVPLSQYFALYSSHLLMFVSCFIRIERGSDGGHVFKLNKVPIFARKPVNVNVSRSAAPKQPL